MMATESFFTYGRFKAGRSDSDFYRSGSDGTFWCNYFFVGR
jgi:hypothetical protein